MKKLIGFFVVVSLIFVGCKKEEEEKEVVDTTTTSTTDTTTTSTNSGTTTTNNSGGGSSDVGNPMDYYPNTNKVIIESEFKVVDGTLNKIDVTYSTYYYDSVGVYTEYYRENFDVSTTQRTDTINVDEVLRYEWIGTGSKDMYITHDVYLIYFKDGVRIKSLFDNKKMSIYSNGGADGVTINREGLTIKKGKVDDSMK